MANLSRYRGVKFDRDNNRVQLLYDGTEAADYDANDIVFTAAATLSGSQVFADDVSVSLGTGGPADILWETADANANELLIQLPAGGATDVPVVVIGDTIENDDLGLFDGIVSTTVAVMGSTATATGPALRLLKSRGTNSAPTVVTSGDDMGSIDFYGAVATGEFVRGARILGEMTGTIATTRGPGVLTFQTATDAAPSVLTTAMTISAAQLVTLASAAVTGNLKLNLTLEAGADGVGADGEQLTSGGAAAETDWSAAGSLPEFKKVLRERDDAEEALKLLVSTPVYDFQYKTRDEYEGDFDHPITTGDTKTQYVGVMADEAPWAMHHGGKILNPINAFGYTLLALKALTAKVERLEGARA